MLIVWILLGSAILYLIQRSIYAENWDKNVRLSFRFQERAVTEGESAGLVERTENRKYLSLPTFGYRYEINRNFAAGTENSAKPMTLRRKLALPGRRVVTNRAKIEGLTRGIYSIDNVSISSSDLFHTVSLEGPIVTTAHLTVYPAKIPVQKLSLPVRLLQGAVTTRRMAQEDPFALKSIRPYEIYDSPKLINWKASARTGELKVNQYDYTTDEAILFLLDMGGGIEDEREELIRLASSLSLLFLRRGVSVSLLANCRNCFTGSQLRVLSGADPGHQLAVDESLAQINLSAPVTKPFGDFLREIPSALLLQSLPVAISADPSGNALREFQRTPGTRGGYFLRVNGDGATRSQGGVTLINWNPDDEEVGA